MKARCLHPSSPLQCRAGSFWVAFGGFSLALIAIVVAAVLAFASVKAKAENNAAVNKRQDVQQREVTDLLHEIYSNQMVIMHHLKIGAGSRDVMPRPPLSEDMP